LPSLFLKLLKKQATEIRTASRRKSDQSPRVCYKAYKTCIGDHDNTNTPEFTNKLKIVGFINFRLQT